MLTRYLGTLNVLHFSEPGQWVAPRVGAAALAVVSMGMGSTKLLGCALDPR